MGEKKKKKKFPPLNCSQFLLSEKLLKPSGILLLMDFTQGFVGSNLTTTTTTAPTALTANESGSAETWLGTYR